MVGCKFVYCRLSASIADGFFFYFYSQSRCWRSYLLLLFFEPLFNGGKVIKDIRVRGICFFYDSSNDDFDVIKDKIIKLDCFFIS